MLRWVLILGSVLLVARTGQAQVLGWVFDQGATELEQYAAQIVGLELYISKAKRGYSIVETGLGDIGSIHGAEFGLHQGYFASLAAVNPTIAGMPEVGEIVSLQAAMTAGLSASLHRWKSGGGLTAGELAMLGQVASTIGQAGQADLDELTSLLTPGKLTMTDDQRIARIEALDAGMKVRGVSVQEVSGQMDLLIMQRKKAGVGVQQFYGLY